jgi:hypothetical protein
MLLVPMASTLTQPEMDKLEAYIHSGKPALLIDDPYPMSDPAMAPMYPKGGPRNPMMEDREPQPEKGSIVNLLRGMGISWNIRDIAWDSYNPHPEFAEFPRTYAFIGAKSGMENAFHVEDPVTADLQEMVLLDAGIVEEAPTEGIRYRPLLLTSPLSGTVPLNTLYRRGMFGMEPNPNARDPIQPASSVEHRGTKRYRSGDCHAHMAGVGRAARPRVFRH